MLPWHLGLCAKASDRTRALAAQILLFHVLFKALAMLVYLSSGFGEGFVFTFVLVTIFSALGVQPLRAAPLCARMRGTALWVARHVELLARHTSQTFGP